MRIRTQIVISVSAVVTAAVLAASVCYANGRDFEKIAHPNPAKGK